MAWNVERAIALGTDIFGFIYLPKLLGNYVAKRVAVSQLDQMIEDKCGASGAGNRDTLVKQLGDELTQKRWDVYKFPAIPKLGWKIPFFGSLNFATKWAGGWALGGDAALLMGYGLLNDKNLAWLNYGFALGLPLATQIPFIWDLKFYQEKGALPNALKVTSENIQCKNEGPKDGKSVTADEKVTDAVTVPDSSSAMMVSAAEAGGIPVTSGDLSSQVLQVYGTGAKSVPGVPSLSTPKVAGSPVKIGAIPAIPISFPTIPAMAAKPVIIVRPVPVAP